MEAMKHFIPAGFEASNGVLIALLGLCLRSRHMSPARNGDAVAYFALLKKASVEYLFRFGVAHASFQSHSTPVKPCTSCITKIMNKEKDRRGFIFFCTEMLAVDSWL